MSSLYSVSNCLELSELLFSSGLAPSVVEYECRGETKDCRWIWRDAGYWLYSQRAKKILWWTLTGKIEKLEQNLRIMSGISP